MRVGKRVLTHMPPTSYTRSQRAMSAITTRGYLARSNCGNHFVINTSIRSSSAQLSRGCMGGGMIQSKVSNQRTEHAVASQRPSPSPPCPFISSIIYKEKPHSRAHARRKCIRHSHTNHLTSSAHSQSIPYISKPSTISPAAHTCMSENSMHPTQTHA